jgi:hypothetical protein
VTRQWGSREEIDAHVFEEYGRTTFELQRLEFALERLVAQSGTSPERPKTTDASAWVAWIDSREVRRATPGNKLKSVPLDRDLKDEVESLLERRHEFAHELLLAGRDSPPHFDPALARERIANMRSLAADARGLSERLTEEWTVRVRSQR